MTTARTTLRRPSLRRYLESVVAAVAAGPPSRR
jgi:hypothetical protein